jgi:hypothetical protein
MQNLLSLNFWFNLKPGPLLPIYQQIFITIIIILAISFFILLIIKAKKVNLYNKFLEKLHSFSLINCFIGLILLFFNYELIPFLSSRFWFLLWGLGIIIWLFFIFKILKEIPERKKKILSEKEYKKYIP